MDYLRFNVILILIFFSMKACCPSLGRTLPAKLLSEIFRTLHSEKLPRESETVSSKPDPWRSITTTLLLSLSAANTQQRAYDLGFRGRTAEQQSIWIGCDSLSDKRASTSLPSWPFIVDIIHPLSTDIHLKRNLNQSEIEAKLIHRACCHTDIDDNRINHLKDEDGKMATSFGN